MQNIFTPLPKTGPPMGALAFPTMEKAACNPIGPPVQVLQEGRVRAFDKSLPGLHETWTRNHRLSQKESSPTKTVADSDY